MESDRRRFIGTTAAFGVAVATPRQGPREAEPEISAPEDLMREHGVLNRILLIFEEGVRRLRAGQDVAADAFHTPATLVRRFVEDYHERLEERFIFPQFKKGDLADLAAVLREQHDAGRRLTDIVLRGSEAGRLEKPDTRQEVIQACEAFIRMYRPHEAREDTVLFPALYQVAGAKEVHELGEQFEAEEHRLFGEGGFERTVKEVAGVEKQLGIDDLRTFTPK
jgi:hemerythrin-like domain-containing protein